MKVQVQVLNAFSMNGQGGNPAGVVFDADHLSNEQKQQIARQVGLPETAFVSASSLADYKLEFFTPTKQIPHCGHATIATFSYLKNIGKIAGDVSSKETIDGCRTILFRNDKAFMEQRPPTIQNPEDLGEVLNSLNIGEQELAPGLSPSIVNTGNSFLIVPVRDTDVLAAISYNKSAVYHISGRYGLVGYYVYARSNRFDATTRMFAPFYGINEEAGTGMAAGPLAAFLWSKGRKKPSKFNIEQGRFMQPPSPSLIEVDLTIADGEIAEIYAGGTAIVANRLTVEV